MNIKSQPTSKPIKARYGLHGVKLYPKVAGVGQNTDRAITPLHQS